MGNLVRFFAGMLVALLPRQYRDRWAWASEAGLRASTILSGIAEILICLGMYIARFLIFFQWRIGTIADAAMKSGSGEGVLSAEAAQFGMGFTTLVEYVFSPLSLLLTYFMIEGGLRLLAALATHETIGTLPLYGLAWIGESIGRARKECQLGPRVVDEVQPCEGIEYDLVIASCREKKDWTNLTTIEYQNQFYELFARKSGVPPRPHIYQLKKLSPGRVIRGLHHYSPDEALTEKERLALKAPAVPGKN